MKKIFIFVMAPAMCLCAQTNVPIIPLLKVGTNCYVHAEVVRGNPAYVVVLYDGGGLKIATSNMPPEIQRKYNYSPLNAAKFIADEQQKAAAQKAVTAAARAAEEKEMEAKAKAAGWIYIIQVQKNAVHKYTALINGQSCEIYLRNPPNGLDIAVQNFFFERAQDESDYIMATLQGDRTGQWLAIENGQKVYRYMIPRVRAFDTGTIFEGIPVWQFVAKNN